MARDADIIAAVSGADVCLANSYYVYKSPLFHSVGPEYSCSIPEVVVMQSPDCRELDDLA